MTNIEIEVTPAMEEAGFQILQASGITDDWLGADRLLVAEIYRAMFAIAQNSKGHEPRTLQAQETG
jgi:hypothetical protein